MAEDRFSLAESRISARCVICFNCCRPSRGVSGSFDDRRTDENRMVCARVVTIQYPHDTIRIAILAENGKMD